MTQTDEGFGRSDSAPALSHLRHRTRCRLIMRRRRVRPLPPASRLQPSRLGWKAAPSMRQTLGAPRAIPPRPCRRCLEQPGVQTFEHPGPPRRARRARRSPPLGPPGEAPTPFRRSASRRRTTHPSAAHPGPAPPRFPRAFPGSAWRRLDTPSVGGPPGCHPRRANLRSGCRKKGGPKADRRGTGEGPGRRPGACAQEAWLRSASRSASSRSRRSTSTPSGS